MNGTRPGFDADPDERRLVAARHAAESVGAALLRLRAVSVPVREAAGAQLKTPVDLAAEGWVLGYLRGLFAEDAFLCEEAFDDESAAWHAPSAYWTVDALDGTRSYVEGFDGFCVQVGYVQDGLPQMGVVHEPVRGATYWAIAGRGAFVAEPGCSQRCLILSPLDRWPDTPCFVDSTRPQGAVGLLIARLNGRFLECGSIGLKICRVADGTAQVFAKELTFKLWDVVPGAAILSEAGGRLGLWSGAPIPFGTTQISFHNLVAAPSAFFDRAVHLLASGAL